MRRLGIAILPALLLALARLSAQPADPPIRLVDYRALVRIESPRFSPDGQQIAFLTVRQDFVHDRYDTTLRVMNATGGEARVLVRGMRDLDMPRWSPDGHVLAFMAEVEKQKTQIYTVPAAGAPQRS